MICSDLLYRWYLRHPRLSLLMSIRGFPLRENHPVSRPPRRRSVGTPPQTRRGAKSCHPFFGRRGAVSIVVLGFRFWILFVCLV
jgi:hypothetical protein